MAVSAMTRLRLTAWSWLMTAFLLGGACGVLGSGLTLWPKLQAARSESYRLAQIVQIASGQSGAGGSDFERLSAVAATPAQAASSSRPPVPETAPHEEAKSAPRPKQAESRRETAPRPETVAAGVTAALVPQRKPRPAPEKKVVEAVARHEAPAPVQAPVMERGENRPTQRVTKAEAGIASLAASGVNFTSGRHVGVGDVFPSGEKLISVDPAIGEIITSRRRIVVSDKNPLPEPPASSVKAGNESHG